MSDLTQLNDTELSAVFAVEVAGAPIESVQWFTKAIDRGFVDKNKLPYADSTDAVLPYLERATFRIERLRLPYEYCVYIELPDGTYVKGCDVRLSKAACIALILAARAEKEVAK